MGVINKSVWTAAVLVAAVCGNRAFGGVNVNNGNFYIAYTDFFLPTSGLNIEVTRTYNSRSSYVKGFFGVGWSSEVEGYLTFEGKNLVYSEGGGSNTIHFAAAKKAGSWTNGIFGLQSIAKVKAGYLLKTALAKEILFDDKGRLVKISDRNKNYLELVYENGRPTMMRDNLNNQVQIAWKDFGKYARIVSLKMGDLKARYEYSNTGDLVKASGVDAIPYEYNYDDEHNMTKITYKNGTYKEMAYNKVRDLVTKFRDRDKMVTTYDYVSDGLDPENKFGTVVSRFREGSKDHDTSRFWYEFRRRADGSRYNYKAVTWIKGNVTESIFTECCSTPLVISQWKGQEIRKGEAPESWTVATAGKKSTFFEYYADGLLKKKTTPDGVVTFLTYDPKTQKVASVEKAKRKVEYHYDARGNLAWAYDSAENRRLDLTYDLKGRITVVQEQRKTPKPQSRFVYFRYNPAGKPVEIKQKLNGVEGTIKIAYDKEGEVTGIFNDKGRAVASENEIATAQGVASTFQNLIEIVQPAGVSLTPDAERI